MIIRCALVGGTGDRDPFRVDLPTYTMVTENITTRRAFVDVPDVDLPADVAAFVHANPTLDLTTPLAVEPPTSVLQTWREHLARRYDLGATRWNPRLA